MDPKVEALLAKFKKPNFPYVLFIKQHVVSDMAKKKAGDENYFSLESDLFVLDCSGSHAHPEKVDYYKLKGFELHSYDLPTDKPLDKLKGYTDFGGEGQEHYLTLALHCDSILNGANAENKKLKAELAAEKEKLAVMEEKIKKAKDTKAGANG